jgi:TonB family protein
VISHDEATTLRARDSFPRLPESVWSGGRPYVVKLEICVADDGRVREAVLRSSASARLDPIVLAAVRTWRYRPRLVGGKATPFCHGVVIKYERW